ncbi:MAG TPA: hypothetical protein VFV94_09945 [Polyangiaceae bacterium]|nr:hypothetical protein [Polyangiaceae bacterium]
MKRWLLALAPLPLLLALGAWASARVADRVAVAGANLLLALAPFARDTQPVEAEEAPALAIPTELTLMGDALGGSARPAPPPSKHARGKKAPTAPTPVVFVSQEQVLRLATTRARPHGSPVPASGARPAGLKLAGVAALGIGMQDGDVLTRAVGQPALSSGAVIQAVLSARARRAPVLEGEFWRGTQRWLIRVEQPYLPERHAVETPAAPVETPTEAVVGPRLTLRDPSPRLREP